MEVMLFYLSTNFGSVPTCTTNEDDSDDVVYCNTSEIVVTDEVLQHTTVTVGVVVAAVVE